MRNRGDASPHSWGRFLDTISGHSTYRAIPPSYFRHYTLPFLQRRLRKCTYSIRCSPDRPHSAWGTHTCLALPFRVELGGPFSGQSAPDGVCSELLCKEFVTPEACQRSRSREELYLIGVLAFSLQHREFHVLCARPEYARGRQALLLAIAPDFRLDS